MIRMKSKCTARVPSHEGTCRFIWMLLLPLVFLTGCNSEQKKAGIKIENVRISSAGYMLDVRYRVIDQNKATEFFSKDLKPYIIDQKTNAKLIVPSPPKVGPLTQTSNPPREGKIYFILFANPGKLVKTGDKITLVLDDLSIKNLIVN